MKHHLKKVLFFTTVLFSALFLLSAVPAMAAETVPLPTAAPQPPKNANKWVKNKKGFYSYYDEKGKKVTGLVTINKRKYYFDSKGIQVNGWQKDKKSYYFFRISNGSGAYMMTNTTINGIKLAKTGKAVLKNTASKEKVKVLCNAQTIARKVITKNTMTKTQKMKALYDWTQKSSNIRKSNIGGFRSWKSDWDVYYAGLILNAKKLPARGDCYTYASVFGYLANAVGCKVTICSSGGHGYVLIGKKFYDPSWQKAYPNHSYFGCGWDTVSYGLGLRYRTNMRYTKVV